MKIERVDNKTVKCFLTNDELEQYDIDYKDFIMRTDKAKEVVQEIIETAEEEVGYQPPQFAFDLQIMVIPNQGMMLTFSDKDPEFRDNVELIQCLKDMRQALQALKEHAGRMQKAKEHMLPDAGQKVLSAKEIEETLPSFALFEFESMYDVMNYAASLPHNLRTESALYEMEGYYYLAFRRSHASYKRYGKACVQALEFGELVSADESSLTPILEHGTTLIEENAVKKLR